MTDKYVVECPYCKGTEMIKACQTSYGAVSAVNNIWSGTPLYHSICRNCGSVVRSYVNEPEKLLKRKERKR